MSDRERVSGEADFHGASVGWADQHDDKAHVLLGRDEVEAYAPPKEGGLAENVVGLIEVGHMHDQEVNPVYLTREHAEILHDALGKLLGPREGWESV